MKRSIPVGLCVIALHCLAACDAEDPQPVWLELGAGLDAFESLEQGDAIELVHGAQGGWHVDLALRFGGLGPDGVQLLYRALDPESESELSFATEAVLQERFVRPIDGGWERLGDRVVFDIAAADEVLDAEVLIEVTVNTDAGSFSDSRGVVVTDEEP